MILDTNALSAFAEGVEALGRALEEAPRHHIPIIVLGEFRYGLLRSRKRRLLEEWLGEQERVFTILDADRHTARLYAEIREELRVNGTPIPENDIWIAALARQYHLPILSQDRHFDVVDGIRRLDW